jgi:hypothetical protein
MVGGKALMQQLQQLEDVRALVSVCVEKVACESVAAETSQRRRRFCTADADADAADAADADADAASPSLLDSTKRYITPLGNKRPGT